MANGNVEEWIINQKVSHFKDGREYARLEHGGCREFGGQGGEEFDGKSEETGIGLRPAIGNGGQGGRKSSGGALVRSKESVLFDGEERCLLLSFFFFSFSSG